MTVSTSLVGAMLVSLAVTTAALAVSKLPTLREQAQKVCYDDAMRLCPDAVPDEDRVKACMTKRKAELSPACAAFFNGKK